MSMRSTATRLTRSLRSARPVVPRNQVVARRWASSGEHKAPGSDMPWALGSAAVFVPLGGWVLYRGQTEHAHGHAHPNEAQHHSEKQVDQHGRTGSDTLIQESDHEKNEGKAEGNKGGAPNAENAPGVNKEKQAAEQAEKIESPKEASAVEAQGGEVNKAAAAKAGGNDAGKSDEKDELPEMKHKKEDDKADGKEPSESSIKSSIQQAEKAAVPRVAMGEDEEPGSGNSSSSDDKKDESKGDEPSSADIKASIQQAEQAAVPRAAMADGEQ